MGGAILVLGAVLYPYVYVMARTAFVLTPASQSQPDDGAWPFLARRLAPGTPGNCRGPRFGAHGNRLGFGTVEYFAIETALGIFNVWLGMNSLTAAAQIATFGFLLFSACGGSFGARAPSLCGYDASVHLAPRVVRGWRAAICAAVCLLPVLVGFIVPIGVLLSFIMKDIPSRSTRKSWMQR